MFYPESFKISTPTDREVEIERDFDAPRELVFDAFTKPELVRRWLLGPEGWTMPICESELRVGGNYRYGWRHADGKTMGSHGTYKEIVPPERIVYIDTFVDADDKLVEGMPPLTVTATFVDLGGGKSLVALLAHLDGKLDLTAINYVALRAYNAAKGQRVNFNDMSKQTGVVPVEGALIPLLLASSDPANPGSMKLVAPDDAEAALGRGFRLRGMTAEVVPNGFWPIDFGGVRRDFPPRELGDCRAQSRYCFAESVV